MVTSPIPPVDAVRHLPDVQEQDDPRIQRLLESINSTKRSHLLSMEAVTELVEAVDSAAADPANPADQIGVIKKKANDLARSILFSRAKSFVLLTSVKHRGDIRIGKGSFKKVKYAIDVNTGKKYALAVCRRADCKKPEDWQILKDEIEYMKTLKGKEGIVQIETSFSTADKCYIVMEYCDSGDLFAAMYEKPIDFTPEDKLQIALDCAMGLKSMHDQGLLNRDIKPENILLYRDENGRIRAKIADLGLACPAGNLEKLKMLCGSPGWISPERAQLTFKPKNTRSDEEVQTATTKASDIWPLGALFFALFNVETGLGLICQEYTEREDSKDPKILHAKAAKLEPRALSGEIRYARIDPDLKPLLEGMLQPDPAKRPTIDQVVETLQKISP